MKKHLSILFLVVALLSTSACFQSVTVQKIQAEPTGLPTPVNPMVEGFFYYEDPNSPVGYDPVFAVCQKKVLRLVQNGNGWSIESISTESLSVYYPLIAAGQRSDYMRYVYYPDKGEIHLVDGQGDKLVQSFHNEYNPEYWIWAWSSLMFVKNCRLHIYYVKTDGSFTKYTTDF